MTNNVLSLGQILLVFAICVSLAACESKEEKQVRDEAETFAVEKKALDQLFAGDKRSSVDLNRNVLNELRQAAPQGAILFEGETEEMTAIGDGAVSACSPALPIASHREHCYGKRVAAHGTVGAVLGDTFRLSVKGVGLNVSVPPGSPPLASNDVVAVTGIAAEDSSHGWVLLKDTQLEKQPVADTPGRARIMGALGLAAACFSDSGTHPDLSVSGDEVSSLIGDVAIDADDPAGGTVTISDGSRKIDGVYLPHIKRCAIRSGKLLGAQVREGKIVEGKVILTNAAAQWESDKVLMARLDKADAVRRAAGAAPDYQESLESKKRKSAQAACVGLTSNYNDAKECMRNMGY
ncbi:hypothetical protein [Massilia sp. HP4]|uniref:hypothetical protein n=1 Tax=Massilia sp. HP4 TaxID=2562316 RepID=UPI0010BFDD23|nr:hypothetical protein [Massilia sp. HP4]